MASAVTASRSPTEKTHRRLAAIYGVTAGLLWPHIALAERVECSLQDAGGQVFGLRFEIDHRQFSPPVSVDDPPRRTATTVFAETDSYPAEPFLMPDGTLGFWENANPAQPRMLVMSHTGAARFSRGDEMLTGQCRRTP